MATTRTRTNYQIHCVDGHGMAVRTICFPTKKNCQNFLMDCMMGTEGSERERYTNALLKVYEGKKVITL